MTADDAGEGGTAPTAPAQLADVPTEELRFALVMNGGVSLAVWMGGVAHEINRLTQSLPSDHRPSSDNPYGPLLGLARTQAVVDVISGTSAGGINGAALALAQVNKNADLLSLRSLWAEQGSMDALLRKPFRGQPTSLLKGDEYFLPQLQRAMAGLTDKFDRRMRPSVSLDPATDPDADDADHEVAPEPTEVDLTITTTLLTSASTVTSDSLGQRIPEAVHAGYFTFSSPHADRAGERVADPFDATSIKATAQAIALGARCSASFPFAFEPAFVQAAELAGPGADPPVPPTGMSAYASWVRDRPEEEGHDRSRFVIDGGVLANTPTKHALEAIDHRPADGPLRRVLMLVFPHAPADRSEPADAKDAPPTVLRSATGILGALQSQGSLTFVHEIENYNRRANAWRGGRNSILENIEDIPELYQFVASGWRHYVALRQRGSARALADRALRNDQWSYERIRGAAEKAQIGFGSGDDDETCPYVPRMPPPDMTDLRFDGGDVDEPNVPTQWPWGPVVAIGVADAATQILRAGLSVANTGENAALAVARRRVSDHRRVILAARTEADRIWDENPVLRSLDPTKDYWTARLVAYRRLMMPSDGPGDGGDQRSLGRLLGSASAATADDRRPTEDELAAAVSAILGREPLGGTVAAAVWGIVWELTRTEVMAALDSILDDERRAKAGQLKLWETLLRNRPITTPGIAGRVLELLEAINRGEEEAPPPSDGTPNEPTDPTERLLGRLLTLDAATWLVASAESTGTSLPMKLVQMSLRIDHPFAKESVTPDDKVAGMAVARFSGFLKESWRMNDWTWGRLDAVAMLCRVVLDPDRLRRVGALLTGVAPDEAASQLIAALEKQLYATSGTSGLAVDPDLRIQATSELANALAPEPAHPLTYLPALAAFVAYPIQARIIVDELPVLAAAIERDGGRKAGRSRGDRFLADRETLLASLRSPAYAANRWSEFGAESLAAFDHAGIGRETLAEQAGSDAMIRTATTATGVLATVVDSDNVGTKVMKPVTRVLRGAVMVPYFLVTGITSPPGIARFLAMFGFLAGGVVLALSLLDTFGALNGPAAVAGVATVFGALGYSALRTGSMLHGVAMLGPLVPLSAYAIDRFHSDGDGTAVTAVLVVLAVALGLAAIASLPWPLYSPAATALVKLSTRPWQVVIGLVVLVAVVLFGALALPAVTWGDIGDGISTAAENFWDALLDLSDTDPSVALLVAMVAVLAGALTALFRGLGMRLWRSNLTGDGWFLESEVSTSAGVDSGWAVVYGAVYAAIAVGLLQWDPSDETWVKVSIAWCVVIAAVLLLGCSWWITWRRRRIIKSRVREEVALLTPPGGAAPDLIELLGRRDQLFLYLVKGRRTAPWLYRDRRTATLELTGRGRALTPPGVT